MQHVAKELSVGKLGLAFKAFFRVFGDPAFADQVQLWLRGEGKSAVTATSPQPVEIQPKPTKKPQRSEALTLLSALQREARFVDFIQEPIAAYSDAQIGAAVRDVHRECGKVLGRLFDLQKVVADDEGAPVDVPTGFDSPVEYRDPHLIEASCVITAGKQPNANSPPGLAAKSPPASSLLPKSRWHRIPGGRLSRVVNIGG
jgi:hypothetical protein